MFLCFDRAISSVRTLTHTRCESKRRPHVAQPQTGRSKNARRPLVAMKAVEELAPAADTNFSVPHPVEDGTWSQAPRFIPMHKLAQSEPQLGSPLSSAELDIHELTRAELIEQLAAAEARCARYANAAKSVLAALALSPVANAHYSHVARSVLLSTLETLPSVSSVSFCECSMPSIASGAEAPNLDLIRFDGLDYSEWGVSWSPRSWWLSVALTTILGLHVHVRVSNFRLQGQLRCSLSLDLSSLRLAFAGSPKLDLVIETKVGLGVVPVPLRDSIETTVRDGIANFFSANLLNENSMLFVLRRRQYAIGDDELAAAIDAANRASNILSGV